MKEITSLIGGRIYKIDTGVAALPLPLLSTKVPCGFPSPADDYVEERIDLLRTLVKHPDTTFLWRAGNDSMRGRMIDKGTVLIFDKMIEPKSGDVAAVRIGMDLCVRELFVDKDGKRFLIARNENYEPVELTEEIDVEILGKVIWSITKQ